ncbi:aminopeptidase N [Nocardioides houyundeii]|uniref:aminopeptidase N n=1 Tax=Nocardioides houyundeii TaxID=2045452 RepID=UPI000DF424A5|nr:aminopeptidase N [Nocardioides houyundeii]
MGTSYRSLQHVEARTRFDLLQVISYDVTLDLASDEATFGSLTRILFDSQGGETFLDLKPAGVNSLRLNGTELDHDTLQAGRVPLSTVAGRNEVVVDAVMAFRNDGEGLHQHVDPADGRRYVYGMSFMDAAPSIFACFDQPDLKAPYTFHVTAPADWTVIGNAPGAQVEAGVWEFEPTPPLSTYFVTLVAGPYHLIHDEHDGIPLGLSARQSIARDLDADADELLTMTKACFDEYHRLFGTRYPFGNYHQAFVPEFNAGAMENPGCVTFRDPLVFSSRVTRGMRIQRATTVAHEMAHQWFGNITTPKWWDDLWLNESFAEYMGNRVTADVTEYGDAWTHAAYARRQWGLVADQAPSTHPVAGNGAVDARAALQDFDGISYAKGSSVLKQLNARLGDEVFFAGVIDHFDSHWFGNATMSDLFGAWERAGAQHLADFTDSWLRTAGPDTIVLDRDAGTIRRTPPPGNPADRSHTFGVTTISASGWETSPVTVVGEETPYRTEAPAVVLDAYEDTWAATLLDPATVQSLKTLLPTVSDARVRAGAWNGLRSSFHQVAVAPSDVLDLVEAAMPHEDNDDAVNYTLPWAIASGVELGPDPAAGAARIHRTMLSRAGSAPAGSTLQLAAFQSAVATAADESRLREWLAGGLPEGLELDLDLRWALLVRLAVLGSSDPDELDRALASEPTARSRVEHSRAMASLPTAEAKEWAWRRFTGDEDVANYELEAAGRGMWRAGQEKVTEPFAQRYLDALPDLPLTHAGWVLGTAVKAFFPSTCLDPALVASARQLAGSGTLDPTVHRNLLDLVDSLERRIAVREAFDPR